MPTVVAKSWSCAVCGGASCSLHIRHLSSGFDINPKVVLWFFRHHLRNRRSNISANLVQAYLNMEFSLSQVSVCNVGLVICSLKKKTVFKPESLFAKESCTTCRHRLDTPWKTCVWNTVSTATDIHTALYWTWSNSVFNLLGQRLLIYTWKKNLVLFVGEF